ncbi:hypothetical protein CBF87_08510 [Limosilactobacillus reuteri]|uniref:hypothetical protein n=1 Tax=Limosilactobacillus reuteri TaxID=1598 RepID=UPI000B98939B|nr:hypothetical protein [Limosilactobacillus reuteri]OYS45549.1 hypothetical protein CBF87_08510 [Limosilactobacillus reuteri]OYS52674.1 hypothetical protein CBF81_06390 [Limosilactobacillus reuteri]
MTVALLLSMLIILVILLFCFDRVNLFLLSFMPLFLILAFELFMNELLKAGKNALLPTFLTEIKNPFFVLIITVAVAPYIVFLVKERIIYRNKLLNNKKIKKAERLDDGIISYIMTYIVPLVSLNDDATIVNYTVNTALFLVIMILYIKLELFYINPILEIKSNIYKCDMDGNTKYIMTSLKFAQFKSKIENDNVNLQKVSNTLYKMV